jgi:rare lipoprotein A
MRLLSIVVISFLAISTAQAETVIASWYKHGTKTANGERYNPHGFTAAHRTLPFGTVLLVTYKGKSVTVRINDRGPFIKGRKLDLSYGAARKIGCIDVGICKVEIKRLDKYANK